MDPGVQLGTLGYEKSNFKNFKNVLFLNFEFFYSLE